MTENHSNRYTAYICYSHRDEDEAAWLHRHLERYRVPRGVAPGYGVRALLGRRIGRVFRDKEELPAGQPLTPKLYEALAEADALIVLCSSNAVASRYVNDEIAEFRRLGRTDRIFPVLVEGDPPGCYPTELNESGENLNADMRGGTDARESALIKILAGLMRVGPDDLLRRERRAQRRRLSFAIAGVALFASIAALAGSLGLEARRNAARAHETLIQFFAEHGQRALDDGKPLLAMRYALAARQLSSEHALDYADLLTSAYDKVGKRALTIDAAHQAGALAFSPDGRRIVSGGTDDGTLKTWDATTGLQIGATLPNPAGSVSAIAFSPDGNRIATGGFDMDLRIRDVATGRQIGAPLMGGAAVKPGIVFRPPPQMLETLDGIAFSPDGHRLVSGGHEDRIRLWDADTGRLIAVASVGDGNGLNSLAYSPDGKRIAGAGMDGMVRQWDGLTGREIGPPIFADGMPLQAIAFSPDSQRLALGGSKGLGIWDAATGRLIVAPRVTAAGAIQAAAFLPDGKQIISGGIGMPFQIWTGSASREIGEPLRDRGADSAALAISPDGGRIASALDDKTIRLWDVDSSRQASAVRLSDETDRWAFAISPDGRTIASGGGDKAIRFWDAATGRQIGNPMVGHEGRVTALAFSPDGRTIASGGEDKTLRLWDVAAGRPIGGPFRGHQGAVETVAFSRDGRMLVSGGDDLALRLWDTATGRQLGPVLVDRDQGHEAGDKVMAAAFSADGHRVASAGFGVALRLWDTATGQPIGAAIAERKFWARATSFSADGKWLAVGGMDGTIRLLDGHTGRQVGAALVGHTRGIATLFFSPDGRRLASGGYEGALRIWDPFTGRQIGAPLKDAIWIDGAAFSGNGRAIVSAGADKMIRHWDVALLNQDDQHTIRDACVRVLGRSGRRFSASEIESDPVLLSEWPDENRDVCEGVAGVPQLSQPPGSAVRASWFGALFGWR